MFTWLHGSPAKPPILLSLRSSNPFILTVVAIAIFTDIFAYGIVVPVLPFALTARAQIPPQDIQFYNSIFLAIYGAALLLASPICGWAADKMASRQTSFLLGLVALGGSTALLCGGRSVGMFVAGRVLQGISAAVVWVTGLAVLVDAVGPEEVGAAMGWVGLAMSLAILVAPLLGGIVFAEAGYYEVYVMVFGLIGVDLMLRLAMIERKVARKWLPEVVVVGCGSEVDRMEPVVADCKESPTMANERPSIATEAVVACSASRIERIVARLPPVLTLFGSRRILAALWACMIQSTLLTSFDSTLPLFVRDTFAWDSIGAGLIFLPVIIPSFFGPLVGTLSDRHGPRWFATAGFVLSCPVLILLRLVHDNSMSHKVMLCALLAILGVGLTLALTPVMAEISYAVAEKAKRRPPGFFGKNGAYAQAYGLFNMVSLFVSDLLILRCADRSAPKAWAAGSMIGPILGGIVSARRGWPTATLILGCISIFTALPTAIWTGGSMLKLQRTRQRKVEDGTASPAMDTPQA